MPNKKVSTFLKKITGKKDVLKHCPPDIALDTAFLELYEKCRPYTMTSIERMYALYKAMHYVIDNQVPGDFIECGVWKGGSSMMMALTLLERNIRNRKIYLYDTFEGMSAPTEQDFTYAGDAAEKLLATQKKEKSDSVWCYSPIDEVKSNIAKAGYPVDMLQFVQGKVEDTLLHTVPVHIALLRLDTDWYASTKMELEVLYPKLADKGVLIIDDFGHWEGAKKAVVEYFATASYKPLLQRIDDTGRICIKNI